MMCKIFEKKKEEYYSTTKMKKNNIEWEREKTLILSNTIVVRY